jgi:hypothetical protein
MRLLERYFNFNQNKGAVKMSAITINLEDTYDLDDNAEEIETINDTLKELLGNDIIIDWDEEDEILVTNIDNDDVNEVITKILDNEFLEDLITTVDEYDPDAEEADEEADEAE